MVSASRTGLRHAMPGVEAFGEPSKQWAGASQMISQLEKDGDIGRVAVLDFGTNGGISQPDLIRDAIEQLGEKRMIFLVNIYSPSTFVPAANEILEKLLTNIRMLSLLTGTPWPPRNQIYYKLMLPTPRLKERTHTAN